MELNKDSIKLREDIIKKAIKHTELYRFFQVPTEVKKMVFWQDENGNETDIKGDIKAILEIDRQFTTLASQPQDFAYIYLREFLKTGLQDIPSKHALFKLELKEDIDKKVIKFKADPNVQKYPLINTVDDFIIFLDSYPKPSTETTVDKKEVGYQTAAKSLEKNDFPIHNFNKTFTNNFDKTDADVVYKYFSDNLVGGGHLDDAELRSYVRHAFEEKSRVTTKYVLKKVRNKQDIIRIFYKYYKQLAGKPHGKQLSYASLLGEYFAGHNTKNVSTNFSK